MTRIYTRQQCCSKQTQTITMICTLQHVTILIYTRILAILTCTVSQKLHRRLSTDVDVRRWALRLTCIAYIYVLLGPFYGAIAVPSVTCCRCRWRCRRGHRCAGGVRQRHLVNGRAAARSGEWAQHFSNASWLYTVSQKNVNDVAHYNFNAH